MMAPIYNVRPLTLTSHPEEGQPIWAGLIYHLIGCAYRGGGGVLVFNSFVQNADKNWLAIYTKL